MYDDIELFQRFRFPRCELLEVINNFKDDITLKLKPFFFFPNIVHGAGNVASGVQGIGDVCPTLAFLHSTRVF